MKALITKGCYTSHGGKIDTGDDSFLVEGKAVHLDGMTHWCPTCKVISSANASMKGFITVKGKTIVAAGDSSTCGSIYQPISYLVVRDNGSGNLQGNTNLSNNLLTDTSFQYGQRFILQDELTGEILSKVCYEVHKKDGAIIHGTTDEDGLTELITSDKEEEIELKIIFKEHDHHD